MENINNQKKLSGLDLIYMEQAIEMNKIKILVDEVVAKIKERNYFIAHGYKVYIPNKKMKRKIMDFIMDTLQNLNKEKLFKFIKNNRNRYEEIDKGVVYWMVCEFLKEELVNSKCFSTQTRRLLECHFELG